MSRLSEWTDLPSEYLDDPTAWLNAHQVENFVGNIQREFGQSLKQKNFIKQIGHQSLQLNAWGVLDSVLKLMAKPQDLFNQPQLFISYFVSPPPPIVNLEQSEESISFDLPVSSEEFPFTTSFLKAAFESLPTFMGLENAKASWEGTQLKISWSQEQERLFDLSDPDEQLNPKAMKTIVATLEDTEKELENKRRELCKKEEELVRIQEENAKAALSAVSETQLSVDKKLIAQLEQPLHETRQNMMKLSDYLARSQQLITLLVGQNRLNSQVREAMKRVGWETIQSEYPQVVSDGVGQIKQLEKYLDEIQEGNRPLTVTNTQKFEQSDFIDWNPNSFL